MIYLNLSTDMNTCEAVRESLWKQIMTCP